MPLHILSISTLFPSPPRPAFGKFVANQMRAVAELPHHQNGEINLTIINPIGIPPWPLSIRSPYNSLKTCPKTSSLGPLTIHHPRFPLIPLIGGDSNPARIARAILPLVRRLHAENPFHLIDAQFFFPDGPAAMHIARALNLPFSIKARGSDIHFWSGRPRALAQIQAAARAAAGILSVSAALRSDMAALGLPADKITVHYTGLDHAKFQPTPRRDARAKLSELLNLTLPNDAPLLVCPGALIAIKGQSLAISALTELPTAHLAFAGTGPDEPTLRAQTATLGLKNRVHFLGQVSHDHLPILMSAADAVVLPSEREGLANVWIEALACGAPLVIPNIGGAAEIVTTPAAGRLAERTPAAIAAAITEILKNPPAQAQTSANAARFSWANNAAQLVEYWRQIASI
ncbi:MAG: hypothetical protein RLY97_502 [Pseudomonadota bacterium]